MRVQLVIKPANEQSHAKHPLKQIASLGDARVLEVFIYRQKSLLHFGRAIWEHIIHKA